MGTLPRSFPPFIQTETTFITRKANSYLTPRICSFGKENKLKMAVVSFETVTTNHKCQLKMILLQYYSFHINPYKLACSNKCAPPLFFEDTDILICMSFCLLLWMSQPFKMMSTLQGKILLLEEQILSRVTPNERICS